MKKLWDLSIQKKISGLFLGCFLVLLTCIIFVLHDVYREQMYQELIQRGHYEDELILHQMERMEQNVESCCNNMIINLNLSIGNKEGLLGSPEQYDQRIKEKILGVIENNFLMFPDVGTITILYDNGDLYTKKRNGMYNFFHEETELVRGVESLEIDTLGKWYQKNEDAPTAYYIKVLRDISGNKKVGYIILQLKEDMIYKTYQNQKTDNPSEIYIFDQEKILLSSTQRELVNRIYGEESDQRKLISQRIYKKIAVDSYEEDYYIKEYQTEKGWTILSVLDVRAGMQGLQVITWNIVAVSIVLMLVFLFFTLGVLRKIMHPVIALADHMRGTGVHQIQKIEERTNRDEVGILISSFNQMVDTNGKLIQQVAKDEKEKRKLELALLQMQIKPHFLYNTLDTAFCLNCMNQHQEANRVIKQLAGYYRLVLNHGDEWISFSEELDAVEKYLAIQSIRYSDLMTYAISVDAEMYEFRIPKMTLQPLVENAIYHGIKPSGRKGHILITGELCDNEAVVSVTDDGVGMTAEMFEEILSGKRKSTDQESFGMKSVAERLRLFYGNETSMELSEMPIGTSIVLNIHLKEEERSEIPDTVSG